jgi:hypothetical protein
MGRKIAHCSIASSARSIDIGAFHLASVSQVGRFRPIQPVLAGGPCPLRSSSDRSAALSRNAAKGQKATWLRSSGLEYFAKLAITASVIAVLPLAFWWHRLRAPLMLLQWWRGA